MYNLSYTDGEFYFFCFNHTVAVINVNSRNSILDDQDIKCQSQFFKKTLTFILKNILRQLT